MEYVLVSDIHGNYPSLQAVVDKEGENEKYIILGDIVGLLSYPSETVSLIQELDTKTVLLGNHDKAIFHEGVGHVNSNKLSEFELSHTIMNLSHEQIDYMQELPFMKVVQRGSARIAFTHAYPWPEQASGYEAENVGVQKSELTSVASIVAADYDYVFCGHTHKQWEEDCAKWGHDVHVVNPGTLGYEGKYAVVDTETGDVDLKRVEYDVEQVKEHISEQLPADAPPVEEWY